METGNAAATISQTVWVLAQLRGYTSKKFLADAMGWERSRLSRTLRGERQWTVEDLETAARTLGLSSWGDLSRPLAELVGAAGPAKVASGGATNQEVTIRYPPSKPPSVTALAQVIDLDSRRRDDDQDVRQMAASEWVILDHAG